MPANKSQPIEARSPIITLLTFFAKTREGGVWALRKNAPMGKTLCLIVSLSLIITAQFGVLATALFRLIILLSY